MLLSPYVWVGLGMDYTYTVRKFRESFPLSLDPHSCILRYAIECGDKGFLDAIHIRFKL